MDDINPKDLGPKVYKYDQVITEDDLKYLIELYMSHEINFFQDGDIRHATQACAAHSVAEGFLMWLQEGKPKRKDKIDDEQD